MVGAPHRAALTSFSFRVGHQTVSWSERSASMPRFLMTEASPNCSWIRRLSKARNSQLSSTELRTSEGELLTLNDGTPAPSGYRYRSFKIYLPSSLMRLDTDLELATPTQALSPRPRTVILP